MQATAAALAPPPPPDPWDWACEHLHFGDGDAIPGKFDAAAFAWARRPLECLSPEHPAREVSIRGSAQIGKTTMLIGSTIGCWLDRAPANILVVHPTAAAGANWSKDKLMSMRRDVPRMRVVLPSVNARESIAFVPSADGRSILYVEASGSASGLSSKTCPRVVMDDLSKFEDNPLGDPESLAVSRASAHEEGGKILRVSTAMLVGDCRISRAVERGTDERWHIPCPHCAHMHALEWENFEPSIDPADPASACFSCPACGADIRDDDLRRVVPLGAWVARNPGGDHPSFTIWRAYVPFRRLASIARDWLIARGDARAEHTFYNDVLGLPYEAASDAPRWESLRDRAELADAADVAQRGRIPARRPILACGVDVQGDRIEWHLRAFGRDGRAHTVDYGVIAHAIATDAGRAALDALLRRAWRNMSGRDAMIDRLAIDQGAYTADVESWARRHPQTRVVMVKGASSAIAPLYAVQKSLRRRDGTVRRRQKQAYLVNVSALKASLYAALRQDDPEGRGYQSFAPGLGEDFYRQLTAERRVVKRNRAGVMQSTWELVTPTSRNEVLDTALYADIAARLHGWREWTDAEWDAAEASADAPPPDAQPDLLELAARPIPPSARQAPPSPPPDPVRAAFAVIRRSLT